mgnify:CR=1 FL=1
MVEGIELIAGSSRSISEMANNQAEAMKQAEQGVNQISEVVQSKLEGSPVNILAVRGRQTRRLRQSAPFFDRETARTGRKYRVFHTPVRQEQRTWQDPAVPPDVVQSNSATAQETSATSEELSAQSTTLDSLISRFQLPTE